MSKLKALTLGIFCAIGAVGLLMDNANPCLYPLALAAVLLLSVGIYKYQRDYRIVAQARLVWQADHIAAAEATGDDADEEAFAQMAAGNLALGYDPEAGKALYLNSADRYSGTYIIGVQGSGKSALIQGMIAQEVASGR